MADITAQGSSDLREALNEAHSCTLRCLVYARSIEGTGFAASAWPGYPFSVGTPEAEARKQIDRLLEAAGWLIQDRKDANIHAGPGVALREFPLKSGPVDYALYVDGAVAGAIEAKKEGWTLSGVEAQTKRYSEGLSDALPAYRRPLPFLYESTGQETHFTNLQNRWKVERPSAGSIPVRLRQESVL